MAAIFGNVGAGASEVNTFHINSDVDKSTLSQHHTLGIQPNQASPGDHNHDGRNSRRVALKDLTGRSIKVDQPVGGTLGTQPTFSGTPLFDVNYTKYGNLCHFSFEVDFDNITSFGTGQYYVELPFAAKRAYLFRDGCLHDASSNDQYAITGHVAAGSKQLLLFSVASNGRDVPFTFNVPVNLVIQDNFHIAGTYEIQQ